VRGERVEDWKAPVFPCCGLNLLAYGAPPGLRLWLSLSLFFFFFFFPILGQLGSLEDAPV